MDLAWQTGNLSDALALCILEAAKRAIRKSNPNKSACTVVPKEVTRISKDRGRLYTRYNDTGNADTLELIQAESREITELLAKRRKKE